MLEIIGEQYSLPGNIRKRQWPYVGYLVIEGGMQALCLEGKVRASGAKGRQRTTFLKRLATAARTSTPEVISHKKGRKWNGV